MVLFSLSRDVVLAFLDYFPFIYEGHLIYKMNFAIKSFLVEIKVYFFYSFFYVILLHCHKFLPSVYKFLSAFSVEFYRLTFKPITQCFLSPAAGFPSNLGTQRQLTLE